MKASSERKPSWTEMTLRRLKYARQRKNQAEAALRKAEAELKKLEAQIADLQIQHSEGNEGHE